MSSSKRKILFRFIFLLLLIFFILTILQTKFNLIGSQENISEYKKNELIKLGLVALKNGDVPVGAVLVYKDSIIGRGFNTVVEYNNLTGHAEINAINEAVVKMGMKVFSDLDRKYLELYTTYEPCEMCKGTLIHYNIKKVHFMKSKSLFHWWKKQLKSVFYEVRKQKANGDDIQDSLFLLHPDFPGRK